MKDSEKRPKYTYDELRRKYIDKESISFNKTKEAVHTYNLFITFVVSIVILVALGLVIGYYIDQLLHTKPLFMLLLTLLGIGASFRNLIKAISPTDKDKGVHKNGK